MTAQTIAFIGGGNMARSLIGGLIADGWPAERMRVADPVPAARESLGGLYPGVQVMADNHLAAEGAQIVLLAVKPQMLAAVATDLVGGLRQTRPLMVSIAAGIRLEALQRWFGEGFAIVRCMPNTPALVQSGATALCANRHVSAQQRSIAERILRAVGLTLWLEDEALLDAVTAVSGSGPAYFLLIMEAMEASGRQLGLGEQEARLLTLQTAFGAAKLALESSEAPATLRERVTSKGGTTERALEQLEQGGLRELFERALQAAMGRSQQLADELINEHGANEHAKPLSDHADADRREEQ